MIKIINVGPVNEEEGKDPRGKRKYDVYVNNEKITHFAHRRSRGLAECLRRAAQAVEAYEYCELKKALEGVTVKEQCDT